MYDELDELIVVDQVVVNAVLLKIFQMVQNRLDDKGVQYHVDDIETVFNRCFGQDKYSFVHDLFMTGLTQAADAICDYGLCNEIWTTDKPASDVEKVRKLFKFFELCDCNYGSNYDIFCKVFGEDRGHELWTMWSFPSHDVLVLVSHCTDDELDNILYYSNKLK